MVTSDGQVGERECSTPAAIDRNGCQQSRSIEKGYIARRHDDCGSYACGQQNGRGVGRRIQRSGQGGLRGGFIDLLRMITQYAVGEIRVAGVSGPNAV